MRSAAGPPAREDKSDARALGITFLRKTNNSRSQLAVSCRSSVLRISLPLLRIRTA
jgi:hypothetical protein